jgi:hypothetical protein
MFPRVRPGFIGVFDTRRCVWKQETGGAGGIRTLDRALQPYNGLANRRLQPLGHSSVMADMPDAAAGCKRQIRGFRIRRYLRTPARPGSLCFRPPAQICCVQVANAAQIRRSLPPGITGRVDSGRSGCTRSSYLSRNLQKRRAASLDLSCAPRRRSVRRRGCGIRFEPARQGLLQTHPRAAETCVPKMGQVIPVRNHRLLCPTH